MISAAMIGCGDIAVEHMKALRELEGLRMLAYCDVDTTRAQRLLDEYGGQYVTQDAGKILGDEAIDAVYICTHHDSHAPLAIAACEAGKHVMMEKPLALRLDECFAIADAAERSGITLMTAFKFRYYPLVARAREFVGKPVVVAAQLFDRRWPDDWWPQDPVKGGGNFLSQGVHAVDLLCHFAGSEPERIYAEGGAITHPGAEVVDTAVVTIRFRNGVVGTLTQTDASETPFLGKFSYQIVGTGRSAHLHDRLKRGDFFDGETTETIRDDRELGMIEENREFIRALSTGTQPRTTVHDGIRAAEITLAAVEAMRTGEVREIS